MLIFLVVFVVLVIVDYWRWLLSGRSLALALDILDLLLHAGGVGGSDVVLLGHCESLLRLFAIWMYELSVCCE